MTVRARDLGIVVGLGETGPGNAITDVAGVRVGHRRIVRGDGPLHVGRGPVRTGVTVILPRDGDVAERPLFAGSHVLNGNGEMTGLAWIREAGLLETPVALTNTHSVGVVRDALVRDAVRRAGAGYGGLPVVGETWDGVLSDIGGQHVRAEHVDEALAAAAGPVEEGNAGGGTGMICFGFKGGIGTASRRLSPGDGGFTVGVLVQANFGRRPRLTVNGVPLGRRCPDERIPLPVAPAARRESSVIVVIATDAPLLPGQCERLARRAGMGLARIGSAADHSSGDLMMCFATGNDALAAGGAGHAATQAVTVLADPDITPLFWAVVEATEEAVLNALVAAETMTGRDGITAHRLDHDLLVTELRDAGALDRR